MIRLKVILCIFVLSYLSNHSWAQDAKIDSLKTLLTKAGEDTIKVNILLDLSKRLYANRTRRIHPVRKPGKTNWPKKKQVSKKALLMHWKILGWPIIPKGKYSETLGLLATILKNFLKSLVTPMGVSNLLNNIGAIYFNLGNDDRGYWILFEVTKSLRATWWQTADCFCHDQHRPRFTLTNLLPMTWHSNTV